MAQLDNGITFSMIRVHKPMIPKRMEASLEQIQQCQTIPHLTQIKQTVQVQQIHHRQQTQDEHMEDLWEQLRHQQTRLQLLQQAPQQQQKIVSPHEDKQLLTKISSWLTNKDRMLRLCVMLKEESVAMAY